MTTLSILTCSLGAGGERFPVASLAEASAKYEAVRDAGGFGGSEIGEAVVWCGGVKCATISYNGRVWDMAGEEIQVFADRKTCAQLDEEGWE